MRKKADDCGQNAPCCFGTRIAPLPQRIVTAIPKEGGSDVLVLTRKQGEEIIIGDNIRVTVLQQRHGRVRLGITAPLTVHVVRSEIVARPPSRGERNARIPGVNDRVTSIVQKATPMQNTVKSDFGAAEQVGGRKPRKTSSPRTQPARSTRPQNSARILLAEDDDEMRAVIALYLRREGYEVTECRDGIRLLEHLNGYIDPGGEAGTFDLIVSDIRMPGVFGLTVAEGAVDYENFPPIILITAFGDEETHAAARRFGVRAVLDKPFAMPVLLDRVREVIAC